MKSLSKSLNPLAGPLSLCLLGMLFCLWSSAGSGPEICFTAGCALYKDSAFAGISLWWVGFAYFALLALLALLGQRSLGLFLAALAILGDIVLLALMLATAPCINCLFVAAIFAAVFISFRKQNDSKSLSPFSPKHRRSWLLLLWTFFFVANIGAVIKSEVSVWPLTDNADTANVRMFFSPSCPACRQGIEQLSGKIDVAFFPVAENDWDIMKVKRMQELLQQGKNMAEAFALSQETPKPTMWELLRPSTLLIRMHLLSNLAHIYLNDTKVVPFVEYKGLPSHLSQKPKLQLSQPPSARIRSENPNLSPDLPLEQSIFGACDGTEPCPDPNQNQSYRQY